MSQGQEVREGKVNEMRGIRETNKTAHRNSDRNFTELKAESERGISVVCKITFF